MAKKRADVEAARMLRDSLGDAERMDENLDAQMLDYVLTELAGESVDVLYPEVRRYILSSEHASRLYATLLEMEQAAQSGQPLQPAMPPVFDLSFLSGASASSLQERVMKLAEHQVSLLRPKAELNLDLFARPFFKARADLVAQLRFQGLQAHAFGALDPNVEEELRWLEAVYEVIVQLDVEPSSDVRQLALRAAGNAGIPPQYRDAFAQECAKCLS
jgi:hypothetical protein